MTKATRQAAAVHPPDDTPVTPATLLEFEWVPRKRLRPWALNPNKGDAAGVAISIKQFGWGRPIIANRHAGLEGEIIVGHHALEAAGLLASGSVPGEWGDETAQRMAAADLVPVRWLNHAAKKAHALSLADNQWASKAEVDRDLLGKVVGLDELGPEQWLAAGFEEKEIRALMFAPWPSPDQASTAPHLNYSVIVECTGEAQQTELLERFEAEGIKCKPWVG
jgi:hypothetical protein